MDVVNYHFAGEEDLDSPALVYHEDIIEENIRRAIDMAGGPDRMWPHIKTFKTSALIRLLRARGIRRFKCATIAEAELCAQCGAEHILLSYPLVGPAIGRFIKLRRQYRGSTFWAIGDDLGQLALLGEAGKAEAPSRAAPKAPNTPQAPGFPSAGAGGGDRAGAGDAGTRTGDTYGTGGECGDAAFAGAFAGGLPFLVDVNPGMNRTGVSLDRLKDFCLRAGKIPGLSLMGLHCYDGNLGIKDGREREQAVAGETEQVFAIRGALEAEGRQLPVVVMGGTPTFPCHARNGGVFLSPGTLFVQDHGYQTKYRDLAFSPAAAILTRVISRPREDLFTLDLGYKAIASDQEGERGVITELPQARTETHSEEHWVFRMTGSPCPPIGTILHVIPAHICPSTALYPGIHVVRQGRLVNYWTVEARNRKILI